MPSEQQSHLLQLVKEQDLTALTAFLTKTFPQLPPEQQATYTGHDALESSTSEPALLLVAAVDVDAPEIFAAIWDAFYTQSHQIPYQCLNSAARKGSLPLARVFTQREPLALARSPPPAPHGRPGSGQIVTALRNGNLEYVDFILAQGISLNHEWPRVRVLRTAVAWEQSDGELLSIVKWLVERGVRIRGAGALRRLAGFGDTGPAEILLDAGADVEDLEDDGLDATGTPDSALMEAVKGGHVEIVKLLVTRGANISLENAAGENPKALAEAQGSADMMGVFEQMAS